MSTIRPPSRLNKSKSRLFEKSESNRLAAGCDIFSAFATRVMEPV
ncbi:hypothetical protein Z948_1209 [Sulfitobacter donghicola DSW-25 = KCTC 12864 = JCM 14565]|nr:hypothetical protein Z948_1209 [Sulfitobacter donghicola DSW-25 = KCTC 12864 = JCM 14565]